MSVLFFPFFRPRTSWKLFQASYLLISAPHHMVSKVKSFTGNNYSEQFPSILIRCECNLGEVFKEGTDPNQNV